MNIKQLIDKLIESGIEENEAKNEVKILLEHFYNYTEIDKISAERDESYEFIRTILLEFEDSADK